MLVRVIGRIATYKGKLKLLSRVGVLHSNLTKCLSHAMFSAFFRYLIEVIIR